MYCARRCLVNKTFNEANNEPYILVHPLTLYSLCPPASHHHTHYTRNALFFFLHINYTFWSLLFRIAYFFSKRPSVIGTETIYYSLFTKHQKKNYIFHINTLGACFSACMYIYWWIPRGFVNVQ